jgi:hypothetical protein
MTEEADEDGLGGFTSHFELYLDAMRQAGKRVPIQVRSTISSRGFVAERMWVMRLTAARPLQAHVVL